MAQTVTVTIGRNVGTEPMSLERWNDFAWKTRLAFDRIADLWTVGPARGTWEVDGVSVSEDSLFYYGPVKDGADLGKLRTDLSILATYYDQEAIGMSVGESELVSSFQVTGVAASA
jgi:hypothetical protein